MDRTSGGNDVLLALVIGGALWYWWTQQQTALPTDATDTDTTDSSIVDQVDSVASQVGNYVESTVTGQTRGERNNNPGNIRHTTPETMWQGISPTQADSAFVQFVSPLYGIRALHVNLLTYFNKYGLNTINTIIQRWAPPQDNNPTGIYISHVVAGTGIPAGQVIDMNDLPTATAIVAAIITQENGRNIYVDDGTLDQAMAMG